MKKHLGGEAKAMRRTLRTTNVNERCVVDFGGVDRIIVSVFSRFNEVWRNRSLQFSHKQLDVTLSSKLNENDEA